MSIDRPNYSEICAYVDGALDAGAAARVAYAAARDPETAAQIAQITKLKSVLPEIHAGLVAVSEAPPRARKPVRRLGAALAAGTLGIALVLGLLAAERLVRAPASATFVEAGLATHRAWSASAAGAGAGAGNDKMVQSATINGRLFTAPDLSAARLALQTAEALGHDTHNILHFGYVGMRGCRLSLFVLLQADMLTPETTAPPGSRMAAWHQKGIAYLAVADGMDEAHFQTIVAVLNQYSIEPAPLSPSTQTLLAESRLQSRPCTT